MRPWIGPRKLSIGTMMTRGRKDSPREFRCKVSLMSDGITLHRPIHAAGLYLNLAFAYACGFNFDSEVMDGFFQCFQRMVHTLAECL